MEDSVKGGLLQSAERGLLVSLEENTGGQCSAGNSVNSKAKEAPFPVALCTGGELCRYRPDFCV